MSKVLPDMADHQRVSILVYVIFEPCEALPAVHQSLLVAVQNAAEAQHLTRSDCKSWSRAKPYSGQTCPVRNAVVMQCYCRYPMLSDGAFTWYALSQGQ